MDDERFKIWRKCESLGIKPQVTNHAPDVGAAHNLVYEHTMAFNGWYIWYEGTDG